VLEFLPFLLQEMIAIAAIIPKIIVPFFHNLFVLLIAYLLNSELLTIKKQFSIKIYHRYHFIKHFFIKRLAVIYLTASSSTNSMTGSLIKFRRLPSMLLASSQGVLSTFLSFKVTKPKVEVPFAIHTSHGIRLVKNQG
jgi:hypothetical protein